MDPSSYLHFITRNAAQVLNDTVFIQRRKRSARLFTKVRGCDVQIEKIFSIRNFSLSQAHREFNQALQKITATKLTPRITDLLGQNGIKLSFEKLLPAITKKRRSERLHQMKGKRIKFAQGDLVKLIYNDTIVYVNRTKKNIRVAEEFGSN